MYVCTRMYSISNKMGFQIIGDETLRVPCSSELISSIRRPCRITYLMPKVAVGVLQSVGRKGRCMFWDTMELAFRCKGLSYMCQAAILRYATACHSPSLPEGLP